MTIHDRYQAEKTIDWGFDDGLAPWMTDASTGGTVTTELTNGGRAVLSTGTTSSNDARIDFDAITPSPSSRFDAFGLKFTFSLDDNAQMGNACNVQMGMLNADNLHRIYHQPNHATTSFKDQIRLSVSDSDTYYPTRMCQPEHATVSELIWDYSTDQLIHRYQGALGTRITGSSNLPDPTVDYTGKVQIDYRDEGDCSLYLYGVEMTYYSRANQTEVF